jgi:hypothetical protein
MYKIIGADHKEYGPVSAEQLRQWMAEGRVNGATRVQAEGSGLWQPISEVPEFAGVFPAASTTPPPLSQAPISMVPVPAKTSQMAIWSMVIGALSMFCCQIILGPIAIILGCVALSKIKSTPGQAGGGFALAGIILGALALILGIVMAIFFISNPGFFQNLTNQLQQH